MTAEGEGGSVVAANSEAESGALPALCGALSETAPAKRYTLHAPCGMEVPVVFGKGETVQNGMLLPVSARAGRLAGLKNAYIGITLG